MCSSTGSGIVSRKALFMEMPKPQKAGGNVTDGILLSIVNLYIY